MRQPLLVKRTYINGNIIKVVLTSNFCACSGETLRMVNGDCRVEALVDNFDCDDGLTADGAGGDAAFGFGPHAMRFSGIAHGFWPISGVIMIKVAWPRHLTTFLFAVVAELFSSQCDRF